MKEAVRPELSPRELEIVKYMLAGLKPAQIARNMAIKPQTVNTYKMNLCNKFCVDGNAALLVHLAKHWPQ